MHPKSFVPLVLVVCLSACGPSIAGVWEYNVEAFTSSGKESLAFRLTVQDTNSANDLVLALGTCAVPLRKRGGLASLGPVFTCTLSADSSLPMLSQGGVEGERLTVSTAELQVVGLDRLQTRLVYAKDARPGGSSVHLEVDLTTNDANHGTRVH